MNANSSNAEEIIMSTKESIEVVEQVGCARNCVDLGIQLSYLLNYTIDQYLVVYENCYRTMCQ